MSDPDLPPFTPYQLRAIAPRIVEWTRLNRRARDCYEHEKNPDWIYHRRHCIRCYVHRTCDWDKLCRACRRKDIP